MSDKLIRHATEEGMSADEIAPLSENDADTTDYIRAGLGYFIAHENLFFHQVRERPWVWRVQQRAWCTFCLWAFIHPNHKKLYDGIFTTLQTGLSKLGEVPLNKPRPSMTYWMWLKKSPWTANNTMTCWGISTSTWFAKFQRKSQSLFWTTR